MRWIGWALFLLFPLAVFAASQSLPQITPQDIGRARAKLYVEAAHEPLTKIAPQIYQFAADSERCRLNSGAEACGLTRAPLKDSSLQEIFNYYVTQPVETALNQRQVKIRKSDWTWQPSAKPR